MSSSEGCPSKETLSECLEVGAAPGNNAGSVDDHLAHCEKCQEALAKLAAGEPWWHDAAEALSCSDFQEQTHVPTVRIVNSICALTADGQDGEAGDQLREHELQQLCTLLEPASHPELLGRIGRYELEELIGRGGMGLVFRAFDTELHRVVAIKTLAVHLVSVDVARERFIREGRACAALIHPHIVPVHDVLSEGAVPALVMQYVAGCTLQQWIDSRGPMSWQQATRLIIQILDALILAHENGFIHRDIKPGNVLLEADGARALLTDFGLVRILDDATITRTGILAGTPDYMSPEQALGATVTAASDLFSLGALFYCMVSGSPPFRAPEPMAVLNKVCNAAHQPLSEQQSQLPLSLSKTIDRLLQKQPGRRFSSARELQAHLQRLLKLGPELHRFRRFSSRVWAATATGLVALVLAFAGWQFNWFGASATPLPVQSQQRQPEDLRGDRITSDAGSLDFGEWDQFDQRLENIQRQLTALQGARKSLPGEEPVVSRATAWDDQFQQRINRTSQQLDSLRRTMPSARQSSQR